MSAIPEPLARFRAEQQIEHIPRIYNGWVHFGWTNLVAGSVIALSVWQLDAVSTLEWLAIPLSFLFANLAEHRLHGGPMHHRIGALGLLYDRHTLLHHRYYPHHAMQALSVREFYTVLFPPWAVIGLSVLVAPIAAVLGLLLGANVAWLFVATGLSYFVLYEWLHLAYHLDPDGPVGRLPGIARLRRHHTLHHHPKLMRRHNFNVTFPIADRLLGTYIDRAPRGGWDEQR